MSIAGEGLGESRVSRAEALARRLETEITSQALEPGERLGTKSDLRRRFGVAFQTVNEALRLMESRGLVLSRPGPGGGIFVAAPRDGDGHIVVGTDWEHATLGDCAEVRAALEPLICRQAARHRGEADVAELERCVDAMAAALEDPHAYLRANWAFHRRTAQICQNVALRSMYLTMLDFLELGLDDFEFDRDEDQSIEVHRELVVAIAAGEGGQLDAAIRAHADQSPLPS